MKKSRKKIEVSVTPLFQFGLLIVLIAICAGIWKNRYFGPNFVDDSSPVAVTPVQPNSPVNVTDPEELLPLIKKGDGRAIQASCSEARMAGNMQFVMQVYLLICEHGSLQAMQGFGPIGHTASANDLADYYRGISILLDRKEYASVRQVISQPITTSLLPRGLWDLIEKEFARNPWNAERFESLANSLKLPSDKLAELARASLKGPPERFEWVMDNLERLGSSATVLSLQISASEINEATIERVLKLGTLLQTDKQLLFVDCLPYLKPQHFDLVRSLLKVRPGYNEQSPLMDYLLKQDANNVLDWLESDQLLRNTFVSRFKNTLNSTETNLELEKFSPFCGLLARLSAIGGEFDFYRLTPSARTDRVTWLWKHGIRPRLPQHADLALYLAVDNRDIELLKESLKHSNVQTSLTVGVSISLHPDSNQVWKESENHAVLVAIKTWDLEAIKAIMTSEQFDWKNCRHGLLLSALKANRKDIYQYLVDLGVEWNSNDTELLKKSANIDWDKEVLEMAFKGRWHESVDFASSRILKAAKAGDYELLDKTLLNFPFRSDDTVAKAVSLDTFKYTLMQYETQSMYWLSNRNVREAMFHSIKHPKLFARLLAEGCKIDLQMLTEIKKSGNLEVLEMAFSDLSVRELAEQNNFNFLFDGQVSPEVLQLVKDLGLR